MMMYSRVKQIRCVFAALLYSNYFCGSKWKFREKFLNQARWWQQI